MEPPEEKVVRGGQVRELHLKGKGMGEADIAGLAEALEDNETLTTLDLEGNDAGSYGVESLARVLTVNDTLTHLNLKDNNVDDEGVRKLAEVRSLALAPTAAARCEALCDGDATVCGGGRTRSSWAPSAFASALHRRRKHR